MKIDFAKMTKWITIQVPHISCDEYGDSLLSWSDYDNCWANLTQIKSVEKDKHIKQIINYHQIIIRFMPNITNNMRITYKESIFDIVSVVNHQEQSKFLIIKLKEKL